MACWPLLRGWKTVQRSRLTQRSRISLQQLSENTGWIKKCVWSQRSQRFQIAGDAVVLACHVEPPMWMSSQEFGLQSEASDWYRHIPQEQHLLYTNFDTVCWISKHLSPSLPHSSAFPVQAPFPSQPSTLLPAAGFPDTWDLGVVDIFETLGENAKILEILKI